MTDKQLLYLDGQFIPEDEARVSIFDRGFLYGDGVFETMRAYGGCIFRLADHVRRLQQSAELVGLHPDIGQVHLADICNSLIERNGLQDAMIRISITRGRSVGGIGIASAGKPTIVAFVRPPMPLPTGAYEKGVSAKVVSIRRTPSASLDSRIKAVNFLNNILARAEAEEAGAYEAIMLTQQGHVAEASTSNVFFAAEDRLVTPSLDCDILPGVTRAVVLELAADMNIPVEETIVDPSEINGFRECFLTNSGIELLSVTRINDNIVGSGKPGPFCIRLHEAYRDLARRG